jgi:hypothetical protein
VCWSFTVSVPACLPPECRPSQWYNPDTGQCEKKPCPANPQSCSILSQACCGVGNNCTWDPAKGCGGTP